MSRGERQSPDSVGLLHVNLGGPDKLLGAGLAIAIQDGWSSRGDDIPWGKSRPRRGQRDHAGPVDDEILGVRAPAKLVVHPSFHMERPWVADLIGSGERRSDVATGKTGGNACQVGPTMIIIRLAGVGLSILSVRVNSIGGIDHAQVWETLASSP